MSGCLATMNNMGHNLIYQSNFISQLQSCISTVWWYYVWCDCSGHVSTDHEGTGLGASFFNLRKNPWHEQQASLKIIFGELAAHNFYQVCMHGHLHNHNIMCISTAYNKSTYPPRSLHLHCRATWIIIIMLSMTFTYMYTKPVMCMNRKYIHNKGYGRWAWLEWPTKIHYLWRL